MTSAARVDEYLRGLHPEAREHAVSYLKWLADNLKGGQPPAPGKLTLQSAKMLRRRIDQLINGESTSI
jgi:hypothetical protein